MWSRGGVLINFSKIQLSKIKISAFLPKVFICSGSLGCQRSQLLGMCQNVTKSDGANINTHQMRLSKISLLGKQTHECSNEVPGDIISFPLTMGGCCTFSQFCLNITRGLSICAGHSQSPTAISTPDVTKNIPCYMWWVYKENTGQTSPTSSGFSVKYCFQNT